MQYDTVRAAFTLAVGLFAWMVLGTQDAIPVCEAPVESQAIAGYTTAVRCGTGSSTGASLRGPARRLFGHRVDLNCSDPLTLQTLAGVGPARARAIIEERNRGRYERIDELTRVRGIGPKTLKRLRGSLVVTPNQEAAEESVVEGGPTSVESLGCRSNS